MMMGKRTSKFETQIISELERCLPAFRSFASGLCRDRFVADDLVQSACRRALERLDQVREVSGVKSWMYRIIYTQWQDLLRKRTRRRAKLISFGQSQAEGWQANTAHNEMRSNARIDIKKGLEQLSEDNRAAFVLITMSGYDYSEASRILAVPVGTVASRVARAKAQLADYMNRQKIYPVEKSTIGRAYDESCG